MEKKNTMLQGNLWKSIFLFALPLALSSILQQLFNSADVAVVGQFAGSKPLAAVGANGSIINLLINSFVGLSIGTNVVIANFIGQGITKKIKHAVHTSIIVSFLIGVVLLIVGFIFARPMLELISTPENILDMAELYLRIYLFGAPFILLYNFEAAILRSRGETKLPLYTLFVSGVINIVLNLFFVIVLKMSVAGVALATTISNIVSATILFVYLLNDKTETHVSITDLKIDLPILKQICKIGLPAALQGAVFSISNVVIQSAINGFGADAIAGSAAALNFEFFAYYLLAAFGQAAVTFIGQNYGAGQLKRCHQITKVCLIEGIVAIIVLCSGILFFARPLASIFTSDPKVLDIEIIRMYVLLSFEILNVCIEVLSGTMRGYGFSMAPALITVVGVCGVRILWIYTGAKSIGTFTALMFSYPISWAITVVGLFVAYFYYKRKLKAEA